MEIANKNERPTHRSLIYVALDTQYRVVGSTTSVPQPLARGCPTALLCLHLARLALTFVLRGTKADPRAVLRRAEACKRSRRHLLWLGGGVTQAKPAFALRTHGPLLPLSARLFSWELQITRFLCDWRDGMNQVRGFFLEAETNDAGRERVRTKV